MRKTKKQRFRASILAILLIASMVFGMVPNSAGQVYAKESTSSSSEEEPGFIDKAINFFQDTGDKIASFFGAGDEAAPAAAFDETSIVDAETSQGWKEIVEYTTRNIGRIWTDKSVYNNNVTLSGHGGGADIPITKPEGSDFMVGLSALSSTSNTSVTTSTPLDIVLVLDVSGSMADDLTTYVYEEAYDINKNGWTTYYALDKTGEYVEVERVTNRLLFDHWELNGVTVEPKTRNDNDPDHIQFYTRKDVDVTKMDALKTAVNGFIDATAEQNASITDPDKQHHISIVKYAGNKIDEVGDEKYQDRRNWYNYSQIVSELTPDMDETRTKVSSLTTGGATSADYGMEHANSVLNPEAGYGARANAKKVVVMFTDGEPNHNNGFDGEVANDAINSAKTLKDAGALVYSVGVVSGADPEDTSKNINAYLHGISSNYPNATGYKNLGDRAANSNYYKAATNSEELNNIFKEISEEINTGTGYPTETKDGFANEDGYVTFRDQLGDYMQVDSFNKLVLEDITFEQPKKTKADGVITYTYEGSAGEGKDVSDIVITVTPGTGSKGDTVDVSIPAALLPLRNFHVDITGNTMTVEDKYPLRIFYNVSLRENVKKSLANPDQEMKNYIANNQEGGNVYFYSNKFTGSKQGPIEGTTLGDTVATFEPATGNSFYYFTENTPLYVDKEMTTPLTTYNVDGTDTYYYEKTYYELENGKPKEVKEAVSFRSHPRDEIEDWVGNIGTGKQLYIKVGAPRLTRIHDLTSSKDDSAVPGTATEVIAPNWDDELAQRNIEVSLGNNGRLAVELPRTLEIKKTVISEVEAPKDKDFTFMLSLKNAEDESLVGEFDAQKFNAQGEASGNPIKVQHQSTVTLKDGESVKIYGLSNGDKYSIEEINIPKGFTVNNNPIQGDIKGDKTVTAAFENTYAVTPAVLEGKSSIHVKKTLTGRDWLDSDSFNIALKAIGGAPLPEGEGVTIEGDLAIKNVTKDETKFSFGKITFKKPGTYIYNIAEPKVSADAMIPGIDYSGAVYRVDVVVTDDGEGKLTATSTMKQIKDDQGLSLNNDSGKDDEDGIAEFVNKFEAQSVSWGLRANKVYTDNSGAKPLTQGAFKFKIETVTDENHVEIGPLPGGATSYEVTNGIGGNISFGQATFDSHHVGKKYLYKITEVVPNGVTAENPTKDGMTYDTSVYYLELSFGSIENPENSSEQIMTITPVYMDTNKNPIPDITEVVFKNEYTPTPVSIGDDTNTAIKGSKILNGRAMNADEFSFELTAGNLAAVNGLADDSIVFGEDKANESMTVNAPAADNGKTADFAFGQITFTKPGTYTFNMKEVIPNEVAGGMTYDTHTEVVTVTVTDNNGVLTAATTYDEDGAAFVNTYKASHKYVDDGGALVTKTLTGRNMRTGEFNFTIEGTGANKEGAHKKLSDADKTFTHYAAKADVPSEMRKLQNVSFTEADAGQTFTYLIKEVIPADDKKAGGVTYDQSEFTLAITVGDDGDGTMSTTTTVTRIKAADGTEVNEEVGRYTSAENIVPVPFVNSYTPDIVTIEPGASAGKVTKVLKGNRDTALNAGEFNFQMTMTPADNTSSMENVVLPEGANNGTVTASNAADGSVRFGNIQFKAAGNYHVEISEVIPENADPNMTYDKHRFSYDIKVTYDAGTGELSAKAVENSKSGSPTFTNIYEAEDAKDVANKTAPTTSVNGKIVGVGDQLTYTIDWVNNAVDDATDAPTKARVTITDKVPTGTEYVSAENKGVYDKDTNTITWDLGEQKAGASGTVSFVVKVLDSAGGTEVANQAKITVGNNDPKQTNTVTTKVPGKDSAVEEGGELQVGKVLTYTISYMNPEEEASTVTIKDIIPKGLDYVEDSASDGAVYNEEDRTLTWTIADVQPGTKGTVTFDARVNESAKTVVKNKATIQIGENGPTYDTDTDSKDLPKDGNLAISKTIALTGGQGTEINKEQTFTFAVELKDAKGSALTKKYAYTVTDGDKETAEGKIANAGTISLKHGQKAIITGLPAGAQYKVTETKADGYTADALVKEGTVAAEKTANADFTNTYSVTGSLSGSDALTVTKVLAGREWLESDRFAYTLTPADKATTTAVKDGFITLPANAGNLEITKASAEHQAVFGDIQFMIAGTFKFNVTEQSSGIAGITDDKNVERTVVVKVTDKKNGTLEAIVDAESENLTFTNTYGAGTGDEDIAAQIPATKKLTGRDMKAEEFQFEVVTRKANEAAEGFEEEVVATGTNAAAQADTAGTVTFAGKDDVKLTYTVESLNKAVEAGYAVKEVKEGQSVWTVSYTARELTDKLPGGVKAVEGKTSYDFTIVVTDNNNGTLTAEVQAPKGGIAFENAYTTGGTKVDTDPTDVAAYFNKVLKGRDWLGSDEFTFTIAPQDGAPAPEKATATVKNADAKAGDSVPFGFGKITFTDKDMAGATANEDGTLSKTFTYEITENDIDAKKMPGVTKDSHVATLTIFVTDNQQGKLSASASMTAENGTFTNTYESSLDYTALSGLQITKVLKGRDMEAGQFTFTVTPKDKASADKLGLTEGATEFTNTAKPAGETDTIDVLAGKTVTFTQADAGKTFTYTVAEKAGDNSAYTYDDTPRTVTIEVKDNKNATLTVTTTVKKGDKVVDKQSVTTGGEGQKATVAFENTYNANPTTLGGEGNVKINAKKSLTNRPMVADEFTFNVEDNKKKVVTTGKNGSDGNITFDPIQYTTDKLIEDEKAGIATKTIKDAAYVYTYEYNVVEADSNFDDGVTPISPAFAIKVVVTDDGNGKLSINVVYPDGTDNVLPFENAYGADANGVIEVKGKKTLKVESGDNAPDITGKYTFTIEGSEGAPMPEETKATNDAAGNVDFGTIQYTMENVFGSEPAPLAVDNTETDETGVEPTAESDEVMPVKSEERTKEFTYTVKESGNVAGVDNDSDKTFKVTVTDNGDGTIKVDGPKEFAFEFTNTYSVDPVDYSINTDLTINKELDGRELREGEFTFELVSEDGKVVSTATNSADGSVAFKAITYKTPGTYNYVIREQKGSAGGVEYDSAEHTVVVVVTDNGDGTMTAKAELKSRDDEDAKNTIVFKNSYTAQPASVTLGASKAYTGGKLGDGQFTFELRDESDKLISKAKNNENGQIVFETIEYKNVGTYKYKISEVNDEQKHVTYDKTVYGVTVTVTDNGEGSLMATVEYDGGKAPVFTNKYSKPAKPAKPEEPKGPTAVKTGDEAPVIPFIILMVATLAIIVTITFIFFRRKRR